MRADSAGFESLDHRLCEILHLVGDRNHTYLLGRQPERECARVVLDQPPDESLHRSNENTMQHRRPVRCVVSACVFEPESLRKIEVELNGRSLPLAADRVDQLEVQLRTIERKWQGPTVQLDFNLPERFGL